MGQYKVNLRKQYSLQVTDCEYVKILQKFECCDINIVAVIQKHSDCKNYVNLVVGCPSKDSSVVNCKAERIFDNLNICYCEKKILQVLPSNYSGTSGMYNRVYKTLNDKSICIKKSYIGEAQCGGTSLFFDVGCENNRAKKILENKC